MTDNRIVNGNFKTGDLAPWTGFHAVIAKRKGLDGVRLLGGDLNSYISQYVKAEPGESFELNAALTNGGTFNSPQISVSIAYYNAAYKLLGHGLIRTIPSGRLTDEKSRWWVWIASPAPPETAQAMVVINKLPQLGAPDVIVEHLELYPTGEGGPKNLRKEKTEFVNIYKEIQKRNY
ncbi:NTTRR-F1 domain [Metabacillus sp. SLBN-84]